MKITWIVLLVCLALAGCDAPTPTTVYLVRHAEKDLTDTTDNPALTAAGEARAQQLAALLEGQGVSAIYSTAYTRNRHTVAPLAARKKLDVRLYEPHDWQPMFAEIAADFQGKTVVICGHSNTLLPMIDDLGGQRPMAEIPDAEYDTIFLVHWDGQQSEVKTISYALP